MSLYGPEKKTVWQGDENPAFAEWWDAWPLEHRIAKGAARREWYRLRPNKQFARILTDAVLAQSKSQKWLDGYVPRPDRWLKDERWEDFVVLPKLKPVDTRGAYKPYVPWRLRKLED